VTSVNHYLPRRKVTVGVDTHKHPHAAVALDELGARLGALIRHTVVELNRPDRRDRRDRRQHGKD
jgi:hypothetical protein